MSMCNPLQNDNFVVEIYITWFGASWEKFEKQKHQSREKGNSTVRVWKARGCDIVTVKHSFYNMCMHVEDRECGFCGLYDKYIPQVRLNVLANSMHL